MAKFYGKNKYLAHREFKYFAWGLLVILAPAALAFLFAGYGMPRLTLTAALITLLVIIVLVKPLSALLAQKGMQFYRGGAGEKAIRKILEKLPDNFSVFENVQIGRGRGNIDFVVVCPQGVFLLEVKSHGGEIYFNGSILTLNGKNFRSKNFLRQVHGEVWALKQYLQKLGPAPYIHSALVFSSQYAGAHFGYRTVDNVYVIQKDFLLGLFGQFPAYRYPTSRESTEAALLETTGR